MVPELLLQCILGVRLGVGLEHHARQSGQIHQNSRHHIIESKALQGSTCRYRCRQQSQLLHLVQSSATYQDLSHKNLHPASKDMQMIHCETQYQVDDSSGPCCCRLFRSLPDFFHYQQFHLTKQCSWHQSLGGSTALCLQSERLVLQPQRFSSSLHMCSIKMKYFLPLKAST